MQRSFEFPSHSDLFSSSPVACRLSSPFLLHPFPLLPTHSLFSSTLSFHPLFLPPPSHRPTLSLSPPARAHTQPGHLPLVFAARAAALHRRQGGRRPRVGPSVGRRSAHTHCASGRGHRRAVLRALDATAVGVQGQFEPPVGHSNGVCARGLRPFCSHMHISSHSHILAPIHHCVDSCNNSHAFTLVDVCDHTVPLGPKVQGASEHHQELYQLLLWLQSAIRRWWLRGMWHFVS
jgi:hypothetical protein